MKILYQRSSLIDMEKKIGDYMQAIGFIVYIVVGVALDNSCANSIHH